VCELYEGVVCQTLTTSDTGHAINHKFNATEINRSNKGLSLIVEISIENENYIKIIPNLT